MDYKDIMIAASLIVVIIAIIYDNYSSNKKRTKFELESKEREDKERKEHLENLQKEYEIKMEKWKSTHSATIRKEAIEKSKQVIQGHALETMLPLVLRGDTESRVKLLEQLGVNDISEINPSDLRFMGSPIDYIYFKGLSTGQIEEISFIEIKTKNGSLPKRERQIRDLIVNDDTSNITWKMITLDGIK